MGVNDQTLTGHTGTDLVTAVALGYLVEDYLIQKTVYNVAYSYKYQFCNKITFVLQYSTTKGSTQVGGRVLAKNVSSKAGQELSEKIGKQASKKLVNDIGKRMGKELGEEVSQEVAETVGLKTVSATSQTAASAANAANAALLAFTFAMIFLDFMDIFGFGEGYNIVFDKGMLEDYRKSFAEAMLQFDEEFNPFDVVFDVTKKAD